MNQTELFLRCARAYVEAVQAVGPEDWGRPALGEWDVRALVGHTTRALTTVIEYTSAPEPAASQIITAPEYYAGFATSEDKAAADRAVAARGHAAGSRLGDDAVGHVRQLVEEAERVLDGVAPGRVVGTPFGALRLEEYLRTRTFELVVHGLDLARALGASPDLVPQAGVAAALELAVQTAAVSGRGPELLAALAGRAPLPEGYSVV